MNPANDFNSLYQNLVCSNQNGTDTGKADGPTTERGMNCALEILQRSPPHGIFFDPRLKVTLITGGNCSAHAFDFAHQYLCRKQDGNLQNHESIVREIGLRHVDGGGTERIQQYRDIQAAMNCIQLDQNVKIPDVGLAKMQALANHYQLIIGKVSQEFDIKMDPPEKMERIVNELPIGLYILRVILPSTSNIMEVKGHTLVLILETKGAFFFDPNMGSDRLFLPSISQAILEHLFHNTETWAITHARFYQVSLGSAKREISLANFMCMQ